MVISTVRPYLKGFTFINEDLENVVFSTGFAILYTANETALSNKYLFLLFMYSNDLMNQMEATMGKSSYPSINKSDIENYKIPLPPLEIQEKLVSEIEVLESKIKAAQEIIGSSSVRKQEVMEKYL